MNRNALTEQRRETVIGLLKGMNIKKSAVGGFDKDDVYECMQQLCDLYEQNIEELENAYESEINILKERYQKYDDNNELYVSLIMEAKKSSNEIITQAKTEVETILSEGREQVAKQEKEMAQMRIGMDTEKKAMTDELNAAREAVEAEKLAMKADVDAERERMTAMKNKYSQQLNSMEAEFEEIKINILRTAGKLDSVKSKLQDDNEAEWNMMNDLDTVDFPVSEIEVEDTIAPETPAGETPVSTPDIATAADSEPESAPPVPEVVEEHVAVAEAEQTLTLEDLTQPEESAPDTVDEISFDDIEIELPDLPEEVTEAESEAEAPAAEISFEGLEDLFKEEEK